MGQNRTDKSRYTSAYAGKEIFISAAQYIAELVTARQAKKDKVELSVKFWADPTSKWAKTFKFQLAKAHTLLKEFDEGILIRALNSPAGKKVYSLGPAWVKELFQKEKKSFQSRAREIEVEAVPSEDFPAQVRPAFIHKKSDLDKLEGL